MKGFKLFIAIFSVVLLSACNTQRVEVDLTDTERTALEAKIAEYQADIEAFEPDEENSIPWIPTIELANTYTELGELGKAIAVYEDALSEGHSSKAMLNNVGRLYEKVDRYDEAIASYQRIVDEFFDNGYLRDITWAHIRAGNVKEAEKTFNAWQLEFNRTDAHIQQQIKKLKEANQE